MAEIELQKRQRQIAIADKVAWLLLGVVVVTIACVIAIALGTIIVLASKSIGTRS